MIPQSVFLMISEFPASGLGILIYGFALIRIGLWRGAKKHRHGCLCFQIVTVLTVKIRLACLLLVVAEALLPLTGECRVVDLCCEAFELCCAAFGVCFDGQVVGGFGASGFG